jgi:flavin reductase (DIM6/NTAB) family NADH-FMN oxidoreductase RutF
MRTYLIVSGSFDEVFNVMAADWVTPLSSKPFLVGVAVSPRRFTYSLIKKYREYVISIPSLENLEDVWIVGSESGPEKLKKTKLRFSRGSKVSTPIIENTLANIECRVIDERVYGDHEFFVGEVVHVSYREDVFRELEPDPGAGFLAHVAWNKFVTFRKEIYLVDKNRRLTSCGGGQDVE